MDAHRHSLLDMLDATQRKAHQERMSEWIAKPPTERGQRPVELLVKPTLLKIAMSNGVTLEDVVMVCLGRELRPQAPISTELIIDLVPENIIEVMSPLWETWPTSSEGS